MCWFLVNSGSLGVVFACYQAIYKRYLTFLLNLLGKLDASILFVQVVEQMADKASHTKFNLVRVILVTVQL